jgi:aspartate 1-decarboxylase
MKHQPHPHDEYYRRRLTLAADRCMSNPGSVLDIRRVNIIHATLCKSGFLHLPAKLLHRADIYPGKDFWVWNITAGRRFRCNTAAVSSSDMIGLSPAEDAAIKVGDVIIVHSAPKTARSKLSSREPLAVFVDAE